MPATVVGIIAIVAGLVFCFRGYGALRIIIPIWAASVGFVLGVALVAPSDDGAHLASFWAWVVGIGLALVFAVCAYLYYALAVIIAMTSAGFALGTGAAAAMGLSSEWVVITLGAAVGLALAVFAIVTDLPMVLLVLLSALAGASAVVLGVLLLARYINPDDVSADEVSAQLSDKWWLYAIYIVLAIAGIVSQLRAERASASIRGQWSGAA